MRKSTDTFFYFFLFVLALSSPQSYGNGSRDGKESPHGPKLHERKNFLSEKYSCDPSESRGETWVLFSACPPTIRPQILAQSQMCVVMA